MIGLKINFLDFVALPITIGIGIEYAVNIVHRARQQGLDHGREVLGTTGGAVVLCVVAYLSVSSFAMDAARAERSSEDVTFDKPGTYELHCSIMCGQGHAGMKSKFIVE